MRAALILCFTATAFAQTPAIVHVLADESQVLVGRTLQMRAVVRDAAGNPIPNAVVTWSANQAAAASISSSGLVTARGLATIQVTARSGSVNGVAAIQTIPSRVEVNPPTAQVEIGSQMKFQAAAYDADDKPIAGVNFTWSLTNQRQGTSQIARIDNAGTVSATGEGGAFVFATYTYNETFPGLQRQWIAYAPIQLAVPKSYQLRRIFSTLGQTRKTWALRPRQSMIWSTDAGDLFLNASLSGLANALLNWENGAWRVVSAGGAPRFGRGSMALDFRTHSITRDGKVLTYEDTNINGAELYVGTREGFTPFLNNNVPLGETEATSGLFITRNSYTSAGWASVRANFRFPTETTTYTGLFRGLDSADEMLVSTKDALPDLPGAFTVDADFGIAADGTAFYSVTSGTVRVFYRHTLQERQKLIGVGDAVLGSKVRSFSGGRANSPSVWFDEDGTAIVCALLEDNSTHFLQFGTDGKLASSLRVNSQAGILYRHPAHGVLLYGNPYNNKGNGAHLWKGDAVNPIFVMNSKKLFDQTIQEIESGTVNRDGAITLFFRCDTNAMLVARMGATPAETPFFLFRDGDEILVELPVNLFTLIGGARTGPPHAQMGGNSGSIGEFDGNDWRLTLGIGERLFGTTMWFGGAHGATYNMRKAPNGDIYFTNGSGIGRIVPGGAPELVLRFPLSLPGLTVNSPGQIDVNGAGTLLFQSSTNAGDNRIFQYQGGQAKQLLVLSATAATASTIEGRTVQSLNSFAMDDTGRVIARLQFRGPSVQGIAVWDGSAWKLAALQNETRISGRVVTAFPDMPRASGSRILAGMTVSTGGNVVGEWTGTEWQVLLNVDTTMPNGQVSNNVAALDVNQQGDILFQYANGVNSMVVRRGGKLRQVHNFFQPTPDGDWLIRINAMDFRDDGTVYFLAVTESDEVVMYEARPIE